MRSNLASRRRTIFLAVLALAGAVGIVVGGGGYAMAGSFASAHPERTEHWRAVAAGYAVLLVASAGVMATAIAILVRRRA